MKPRARKPLVLRTVAPPPPPPPPVNPLRFAMADALTPVRRHLFFVVTDEIQRRRTLRLLMTSDERQVCESAMWALTVTNWTSMDAALAAATMGELDMRPPTRLARDTHKNIRAAMWRNEREVLSYFRRNPMESTTLFSRSWRNAVDRLVAQGRLRWSRGKAKSGYYYFGGYVVTLGGSRRRRQGARR